MSSKTVTRVFNFTIDKKHFFQKESVRGMEVFIEREKRGNLEINSNSSNNRQKTVRYKAGS